MILQNSRTIPGQKALLFKGAQWLSGRVLDSRPDGSGFVPYRRHCVVSLSKNINPSLVLVQPRKTHPFITERLLMGGKESNQTNKQTFFQILVVFQDQSQSQGLFQVCANPRCSVIAQALA